MPLTNLGKFTFGLIIVVLLAGIGGVIIGGQLGLERRIVSLETREPIVIVPTTEPTASPSATIAPTMFLRKPIKPIPVITQ